MRIPLRAVSSSAIQTAYGLRSTPLWVHRRRVAADLSALRHVGSIERLARGVRRDLVPRTTALHSASGHPRAATSGPRQRSLLRTRCWARGFCCLTPSSEIATSSGRRRRQRRVGSVCLWVMSPPGQRRSATTAQPQHRRHRVERRFGDVLHGARRHQCERQRTAIDVDDVSGEGVHVVQRAGLGADPAGPG